MSDRDLEQKIKAKLKAISKEKGIVFNHLLETLFLERFLVRISMSKFKEKLIFKGGMCLSQFINLDRRTKDIDFLLREVDVGERKLKEVFDNICAIKHSDGFFFMNPNVEQLSLNHKKNPGYSITLEGRLGNIKNKVSIDIGLGDVVIPSLLHISLLGEKDSLFEDSVLLMSYPPEYIFSEKLEAILWLREINGRMKDYYDCYEMINKKVLNKYKIKNAILSTFEKRETKIEKIPESFATDLQTRWNSFLKKEKLGDLSLGDVIQYINIFLFELDID